MTKTQKELKLIKGWEDNMNKRFVVMSSVSDRLIYGLSDDDDDEYAFLDDYIHSLLRQQQALSYQQGREEAIQECIKLSESMESGDTEFNEWRAFKGFRNALNDLLNQQLNE